MHADGRGRDDGEAQIGMQQAISCPQLVGGRTTEGTSVRYSAGMIWSVSMFCMQIALWPHAGGLAQVVDGPDKHLRAILLGIKRGT